MNITTQRKLPFEEKTLRSTLVPTQIITPYQPILIKLLNRCSSRKSTTRAHLSLDSVLTAAKSKARASEFGDDSFVNNLRMFLDALDHGISIHAFGRFLAHHWIVEMVSTRLRLHKLKRENPEFAQSPVKRPVIILGLPRCGTSLLFNLFAQDSTHRTIANWEAFISPIPPKGNYSHQNDPRRKKAKFALRLQRYLTPDIEKVHEFNSEGPEECTPFLMHGFSTQALIGHFNRDRFFIPYSQN